MKKRKSLILFAILLILLLTVSGCGNDEASLSKEKTDREQVSEEKKEVSEEVKTEQSTPITVTDLANNEVKFEDVPKRIIAFSSGDMETIYALGGEVVGRPIIEGEIQVEEAKDVPEIGSTNSINIEKVAELSPDLVIAHKQLNAKDIPALKQLGINVLLTGAQSIEEIIQSIEMLGTVMDREEEASKLMTEINTKITEFKDANKEQLRSMIIFGVPGNWMVALPNSLSGNFLEAIGGYNIARDYPKLEKFPQYAQLNIERIIEADPEAIFLISPGSAEAAKVSFIKEMEKNPSWKNVYAVKNEHFILLPNNLFGSNPGPRVIESLDYLNKELQKILQEK
ncbi:ABC transporter substrate-binding protein [Cytobacillus massiliigabonensis]|uniref:ABC transporter substrate-binding protein n=1 Tax=Cytobacillus massiliigabonensis TaxID=1871011 RepID=UPI000C8603BD|nr:ABC transporter substrate-binding protein [Cytobacillus massiliigabonensis]